MLSFKKQAYESFTIEADFSSNMEEGETVSEITAVAITNKGEEAAVVNSAAPKGQAATARVSEGEPGASYIITFKAVTSNGNKWELDIKMNVTL